MVDKLVGSAVVGGVAIDTVGVKLHVGQARPTANGNEGSRGWLREHGGWKPSKRALVFLAFWQLGGLAFLYHGANNVDLDLGLDKHGGTIYNSPLDGSKK
jgi:hypothetical protein